MINLLLGILMLVFMVDTIRPINNQVFRGSFKGHNQYINLTGYANFDYLNQRLWHNNENEPQLSQQTIVSMMNHYNTSNFQSGSQYSVEIYRHSCLNAIAYIIYKQISLSQWELYYAVRNRLKPDQVHYMGKKTASGQQPGRDMPFFDYEPVEGSKELQKLSDTVQHQLQAFQLPSQNQVSSWEFPQGRLYSFTYNLTNNSKVVTGLLMKSKDTMQKVIGYFVTPPYGGNIAIDNSQLNSYMWYGMMTAFRGDRQERCNVDNLQGNIVYFEYYLDPKWRQVVTLRMVISLHQIKHYYSSIRERYQVKNRRHQIHGGSQMFMQKFMLLYLQKGTKNGVLMFDMPARTKSLSQSDIQTRIYSNKAQNSYHLRAYFSNDYFDYRITQFKKSLIMTFSGYGFRVKGWCIKLPVGTMAQKQRQNKLCSTEAWVKSKKWLLHGYGLYDLDDQKHRYKLQDILFQRRLYKQYLFDSVDFKDSQVMAKKEYRYMRELGLQGYRTSYANTQGPSQYCSITNDFEIGIFYNYHYFPNQPELNMTLILSHRSSQRAVFIGQFVVNKNLYKVNNPYHLPEIYDMCPRLPVQRGSIDTMLQGLLHDQLDLRLTRIVNHTRLNLQQVNFGSLQIIDISKGDEEGSLILRRTLSGFERISYFITKQALTFTPLKSVDSEAHIQHLYQQIIADNILLDNMQVKNIDKAVFPNGTLYYHIYLQNGIVPASRQNFTIIFDPHTSTTLHRNFTTYIPPTAESYFQSITSQSQRIRPQLQNYKWHKLKAHGFATNYTFTLKYLTQTKKFVTQTMVAMIDSNQIEEASYVECGQPF